MAELDDRISQEGADLIPARMLNELVYCPRLYYLEHVAGEWDDNADTVQGRRVHRRVDGPPGALPAPAELPEEGAMHARSVTVASVAEGVIARTDLIEAEGGRVVPVDYKRGAAPDPERAPGGIWPADRVQLAAQMLALREGGYACDEGVIYYAASKRRVPLPWSEALRQEVRAAVAEARRLQREPVPPPPLEDSPKCPRCSLVGICLPDETRALLAGAGVEGSRGADGGEGDERSAGALAAASDEEPAGALGSGAQVAAQRGGAPPRLRRLLPAQDDRLPLYVQAQGARLGKSGECLEVRTTDGKTTTVRLRETSHVCVFGGVQVSTGALQELCSRDIGLSFFSTGGWYYGGAGGFSGKNVHLRIAQFQVAAEERRRLPVARALVVGKILNCRTMLRRNAEALPDEVTRRLKELAQQAQEAEAEESLLGIEGTAARIYFEHFGRLLAPRSGQEAAFDFQERNRRPPRDPVNALLSFAYALLLKDVRVALLQVGLDPMVGVYHKPRHGRPALALDLMEEFRPLIADSVVLAAVNTEVVQSKDFTRAAGAVALGDSGRRAFLGAYERRMAQTITHPLFGYTISYRRVLEVQARLLGRTLQGELAAYPSFRTR